MDSVTLFSTSRRSNNRIVMMFLGRNHSCFTSFAIHAFSAFNTFRSTSRCLGNRPRTVGMSCCGNGVLFGNDETTYRAVLALGQTACGAGGRYRLIGDCGVACCGDSGLCHDDLAAVGTLAAVGPTIGGTGGCVTLDGHCLMIGAEVGTAYVTVEIFICILVSQGTERRLPCAENASNKGYSY